MTAQLPVSSVALVRLSALGDLVLTLPLVHTLLAHGIQLTWLVERRFLPVVDHLADRLTLIPVDGPRGLSDLMAIRRALAGRHFDALLAAQAKARINLAYPLIPARRRIGFDRRRARDGQWLFCRETIERADEHLADGMLAFAKALGLAPVSDDYAVPLAPGTLAWRDQLSDGQPYLVINPTSSKSERDWPLASQCEFASRLRETGWQGRVFVTGGPSARDRDWAQQIAQAAGGVSLAGATTLPQLFALLAGARVVVTPDSAPVHIATMYGVPVVGLYAVARSALSGPWRAGEYCIDRYDEAARLVLGKTAEQIDWHTRVHDARAMTLITVDDVLNATCQALGVT
ncbi:glycosyltransferase family 9 protein [Chitinibacteraceae bacterium HSL-7]